MDIINESNQSMKKTQLRKIIREAITEILAEGPTEDTAAINSKRKQIQDQIKALNKKRSELSAIKPSPNDQPAQKAEIEAINKKIASLNKELTTIKPGTSPLAYSEGKVKGNLDEFANVGTLFQLAPDADISTLTGQKLRIVTAMQEFGEPMSQRSVAELLGYTKQNPIDANFRALGAEGIIIPAGTQIAQRFSRPAPEPGNDGERPETIDGPESFLIGGGDPLSGMFDGIPNDDGSEDFNDDVEPTLDDLEPDDELPPAPSTDKEKAADFTTDDVNSRLIQSIINNYTALKSRIKGGGEMGGLAGSDMMTAIRSSKAAAELRFPQKMQLLIDKIKEQEPAVQKAILDSLIIKFASVKLPSLAKAIAKELNVDAKIPTIKTPIEEPEEEIEDTLDEAFNREYDKRKLQFYAGIIK